MTDLSDRAWPELDGRPLVLVPIGSVAQHGPHLPLSTDLTIAEAVASGIALTLKGEVLIAPPLSYGSSGEFQGFDGTSSIGSDTLRTVVMELTRSMSNWAGRVVFVNAYEGNRTALSRAIPKMIAEKCPAGWVNCIPENGDLHAGISETSLMLHLRPEAVRMDRAELGETRTLPEIMPLLMAGGVGAVSPNGVLGDPTGATAAIGERILHDMTVDAAHRIITGSWDRNGMLGRSTVGR